MRNGAVDVEQEQLIGRVATGVVPDDDDIAVRVRGHLHERIRARHLPGLARIDLATVVIVQDLRGHCPDLEAGLPRLAIVGRSSEIDVPGIDQVSGGIERAADVSHVDVPRPRRIGGDITLRYGAKRIRRQPAGIDAKEIGSEAECLPLAG